MNKLKLILVWAIALNFMLMPSAFAARKPDVTTTGYVGFVSNYVWRGVQQNAGATSVQGEVTFAFKAVDGLSVGMWFASIGGGVPANETDYVISYAMESGDFEYTAGLTLYSYDFAVFTPGVATQPELAFGVGYSDYSFNLYLVPSGPSTLGVSGGTATPMLNWIELGYATDFGGFDIAATYGTGTYNHQWLNAGAAIESTGVLTLNFVKPLKDGTSLSFNSTTVLGQSALAGKLANEFWMSYEVSF